MSRTTIIPTAQTKANQSTDLYLKPEDINEYLSEFLPSQTSFFRQFSVPVIGLISPGQSAQSMADLFTVPKTGLYILTAKAAVTVDATKGATAGPSDCAYASLYFHPGPGEIEVDLKVYTMPNTSSAGIPYVIYKSAVVSLTAGAFYQPFGVINNVSGTMAFPGGFTISMTIAALC